MDFGTYIKKRRLELNLTQVQLAKKLDVAQTYITYLEKGERHPSDEIIQALARCLSIPADRLFVLAKPHVQKMFGPVHLKREVTWNPHLQELKDNHELRKKNSIKDEDLEMLASVQARGKIRKMEDYVFLLMTIRQLFKE